MRYKSEKKMISVDVKIPNFNGDITPAIRKSLRQSAFLVRKDASDNAPYQTGTLRRSIIEKVQGMRATVGTNVKYASIHEFGGIIRPKTKKYLKFKIGGAWVTTKQVKIKKKPYLIPALTENKNKILKIFSKNIMESI
jgi:HK97 gp10 family phage protein